MSQTITIDEQTWTFPDEAQINEANQVALKYYQPGQPYVQNTPSGQEYIGIMKANICMIWAKPGDVENILSRNCACCPGANKKPCFLYANQTDVRRWTNGGGR